jgi:hypothetical protein
MDPLPKIARERLRANPPTEHPDADLLTAFAEQSLTERERSEIADHLARCAECREVVAVAVPEFEPTFADAAVAAGHARAASAPPLMSAPKMAATKRTPWLRSPVLRWGALAACVVVVGAAVLNYRKSSREITPYYSGASRDANAGLAVQQEQAKSAPAEEELQKSIELDALRTEPKPKAQPPVLADKALAGKMASAKSGGTAGTLNARGRFDEMVVSKRVPTQSESVTVEAAPIAPGTQSAEVANEAPAASREMAAARPPTAQQRAQGAKDETVGGSAAKETVEVAGGAAAVESQTAGYQQKRKLRSEKEDGNMKASVAQPTHVFAARIADAAASEGLVGQRNAKWSLSNEGLPQRSFDSGGTWEKVPVEHASGFRALSVVAQDVWVGGAAGLLYHSGDNGLHWTRVVPSVDGVRLQADISHIEFTDALHGRVTAADGANWATSDGGKTWQRN